jgi:ketosteroid isomerase-like protein
MRDAEVLVRRLNDAWQQGDWETVTACLHPDVAMLLPDGHETLRGREAMLGSYREFVEVATLHGLQIEDIEVFAFGTTAICHMQFTIDYAIDDEREQASGVEVYAIAPDPQGQSCVIWRTQQLSGEVPVISLEEDDGVSD